MKASRAAKGVKALFQSFFSFSPVTRYEARHGVMTGLAELWGFRTHNKYTLWGKDPEFLSHWNAFKGKNTPKVHERRFNMYYFAKSVKDLPGDTAECGVWFGAGSFLIMRATAKDGRTHHIFDSFEGLSSPDTRDAISQKHVMEWKKGDLSVPEQIVSDNLQGEGDFKLYKGWIPERFKDAADKTFSFAHIDVDLYQPTYDSVAFFYDRMVPGGIILCDDYGSELCPGAYDALNDFFADKPEQVIHLVGGQGMIIKK